MEVFTVCSIKSQFIFWGSDPTIEKVLNEELIIRESSCGQMSVIVSEAAFSTSQYRLVICAKLVEYFKKGLELSAREDLTAEALYILITQSAETIEAWLGIKTVKVLSLEFFATPTKGKQDDPVPRSGSLQVPPAETLIDVHLAPPSSNADDREQGVHVSPNLNGSPPSGSARYKPPNQAKKGRKSLATSLTETEDPLPPKEEEPEDFSNVDLELVNKAASSYEMPPAQTSLEFEGQGTPTESPDEQLPEVSPLFSHDDGMENLPASFHADTSGEEPYPVNYIAKGNAPKAILGRASFLPVAANDEQSTRPTRIQRENGFLGECFVSLRYHHDTRVLDLNDT